MTYSMMATYWENIDLFVYPSLIHQLSPKKVIVHVEVFLHNVIKMAGIRPSFEY